MSGSMPALAGSSADASDLTEPDGYFSGASRQDMFIRIRTGAGVATPPWTRQIPKEADAWHLVSFIRSLWTDQQRNDFQ